MPLDEKEFKKKMDEVKGKLQKSVIVPEQLTRKSKMKFRCYPGIGCFTKCCSGIRINLTPYDIFRLKNRLGMSSSRFSREAYCAELDRRHAVAYRCS